jgi:hypothetical protein
MAAAIMVTMTELMVGLNRKQHQSNQPVSINQIQIQPHPAIHPSMIGKSLTRIILLFDRKMLPAGNVDEIHRLKSDCLFVFLRSLSPMYCRERVQEKSGSA